MLRRAQLVMAASLLLYVGPLLAGMSGMGWTGVPVFALLFALWLVVMRPSQWPRDLSVWTPAIAVAAAAQVAINVLLVVFLFAVGRGLAGLDALRLEISPIIPVGLSFLAIPLSRLVWDPVKGEEMDRFLDDALQQLNQPGRVPMDGGEPVADEMVQTLLDLPPDTDPILTADAVEAAMRSHGGAERLRALEAALDPLDANHRSLREAVILWATDPRRALDEAVPGAQESAFYVAGNDPVLLHLFAHRALDLIRAKPALWTSFPDAVDISTSIESSFPDNLQAAMTALVAELEAAAAKG